MIVATIARGATTERVRATPATLVAAAKAAVGMTGGVNAYGPQVNERMREHARGRGVVPGDLPPPSTDALWRSAPVLPGYVVRLLVWAAYADGLPLSAVTIESATAVPRWGVAASGARTAAQRETIGGGSPSTRTEVRPEPTGGTTTRVENDPPPSTPSTPSPSSTPSTPSTPSPSSTPSTTSTPSSSDAAACVATMPGSWHLRETATATTGGREYPAGARVVLLGAVPDVTRGAAERFFRVRVETDGREGFAFIPTANVPACAAGASVGGAVGGALDASTREALKTAGKILGGTALALVLGGGLYAVARHLKRHGKALPKLPDVLLPTWPPTAMRTRIEGTPMAPPEGLVAPGPSVPAPPPRRQVARVAV